MVQPWKDTSDDVEISTTEARAKAAADVLELWLSSTDSRSANTLERDLVAAFIEDIEDVT